MECWSTEVMN